MTIPAVMTRPVAPVQEMARSAAASAAGRSPKPAVDPDTDAASRSARSGVRLVTTMPAAPRRWAVATASALIEPAPTTSTCSPARGWTGSGACPPPAGVSSAAARATPTLTRFAPARSIPVSVCARLAVRNASVPRPSSARLSVPCSRARAIACRTWPRIWLSPTTMESSPAATVSRCWTARSSYRTYRCSVSSASGMPEWRASRSEIADRAAWNLSTSV